MFHILALYRFLYAKWWIQVCRGVDGGLFLPDDFKITFHDFSICFMLAKHYIRWYLWICCCGWRPVLLPWLLAGNTSLKRWKNLAVGAEKPIQSKMICFLCVMCTTCKISFLLRRFFFFLIKANPLSMSPYASLKSSQSAASVNVLIKAQWNPLTGETLWVSWKPLFPLCCNNL